tara:strand:+ start:1268 stop:2674 length:1407 start_codon:yes stop_codon:yes gene_type:complete
LFTISTATAVYSESTWISKKSDKTKKEIKIEKIEKAQYIKKKKKEIKKNKEKYKKEDKKISKKVKSWITKKTKDKYIDSIEKLPDGAIYFTGSSTTSGLIFYGYIVPDAKSELISNYYKTSTGFGYFNDGKTVCKIGSTVIDVDNGEVTARVSSNCSNGINFRGKTTQNQNFGDGYATTEDGGDKFLFDFNVNKITIAKTYDNNLENLINFEQNRITITPKSNIEVNPTGKYYALLIGNTKYANWASLKSPVNDVNEIEKVLKNKYKFEDVKSLKDATRSEIFSALKKLRKVVTDNDYLLIYYAGHGEQDTDRGYWIPVDAEKDWDENWIDTGTVTAAIQRIKTKHTLLMIDSCYVGTSFKGNAVDGKNLSEKDWNAINANKGLNWRAGIVLSSGGATPVVDIAVDNKHSLFAYKFIDLLKKNEDYMTSMFVFNELYKYHSTKQQTPQRYHVVNWGHLDGDFIFKIRK